MKCPNCGEEMKDAKQFTKKETERQKELLGTYTEKHVCYNQQCTLISMLLRWNAPKKEEKT